MKFCIQKTCYRYSSKIAVVIISLLVRCAVACVFSIIQFYIWYIFTPSVSCSCPSVAEEVIIVTVPVVILIIVLGLLACCAICYCILKRRQGRQEGKWHEQGDCIPDVIKHAVYIITTCMYYIQFSCNWLDLFSSTYANHQRRQHP